jgi:DNA-binding transcriptional LysR family regulator
MHSTTLTDTFDDMNNLRLLEYAVALDRHRSFGRAAEAMRVTQPTFSRGIASLEATLGAHLFNRSNRRVEPTAEGKVLVDRARRLLADAAGIHDALDDYQKLRSGRVTVGVGPYPLDLSVTECVVRLSERHPLLQLELIEGGWRDFTARLLAGEVEVAVMEVTNVAQDSRFEVEALPAHQGCFFCRRGHPLTGRNGVTFGQILQYPFVGVRMPIRALASAKLDKRWLSIDPMTGDAIPHIATTSFAAARAIIKRTDGIGIAAPTQLAEDIRQGALHILDADASAVRSGYGIAYLRGRSLSPGARAFVATVKEVETEIAAIGDGLVSPARSPSDGHKRRKR